MVDEAVILTQTVREWFPLFLANGVDYNDAVAITGRVREWGWWCEEWSREARRYEALGEKALWMFEEGNHVCENVAPVYRPRVADWLAERRSVGGDA